MSQDPLTRDPQLLTNSERLGTRTRDNIGAQGNKFIRESWGTDDRFRGVMGQYLASETWDNYSTNTSVGVPLHVTELSSAPVTDLGNAPATLDSFLLEPDNTEWNNASIVNSTNNLLRAYIQDPGINEGNPYYSYYLEEGMPSQYGSVEPVFSNPGESFLDHTFVYLKPSEDMEERLEGGLEIDVEPVYNTFLDTMPPYENVTADVPEMVLPNYYVFEAELQNTGSQAYTTDYYKMITLFAETGNPNRIEDWFVGDIGGYTETTSKSYYQTYATSLSAVKASETNYNALQVQFTNMAKNIAVLNSDVEAINNLTRGDGITSGLIFLPFYNIVKIGQDEFRATEGGTPTPAGTPSPIAANSFLQGLYLIPDFDAESFIDILQMHIIQHLEGVAPVGSIDFALRAGPQNAPVQNVSSMPITACTTDSLSRDDVLASSAQSLSDRISTNISALPTISTIDNVVLLRNYADTDRWTTDSSNNAVFDPPDPDAVQDFYDKIGAGAIVLPQRNWEEVTQNEGAFSETLLYKVDKYVVDAQGNRASQPAQTIYLSPRIVDGGPLQYVDSQVRYGVRYQYDIQQIRVVFGNRYYYDDLQIYTSEFSGYGRAVGNALGFYRPTVPSVVADSYVSQEIRPYYNPNADTNSFTQLKGYFAVDPANADSLTLEQWQYVASGSDFGESEKLDRVNLIFKRGYGFEGNPSGGAVGGMFAAPALGLPGVELTAGPAQGTPTGITQFDLSGQTPVAGTGPTGQGTNPGPGDRIAGIQELFENVEQAGALAAGNLEQRILQELGVGGQGGPQAPFQMYGGAQAGTVTNPLSPYGTGGFEPPTDMVDGYDTEFTDVSGFRDVSDMVNDIGNSIY